MTLDHRQLDPRAKGAFALAVSVAAIARPHPVALVVLAGILVAFVATAGSRQLRRWAGFLSAFVVILPLILVLNAFFYGGGTVLWRAPVVPLSVTTGGLETSAVIALRLIVIAGAAAWFAGSTDAEAFEVAIARLGVPWRLAFLASLTVRLVPAMRSRFRTIERAQRSRGLTFEGGPLRRARARIPMFVPFLAAVVEDGYTLGEALRVRDFERASQRTYTVTLAHGRLDVGLYFAAIALVGGFLLAFA
jgi:energy-coupling factor transport system permease protein